MYLNISDSPFAGWFSHQPAFAHLICASLSISTLSVSTPRKHQLPVSSGFCSTLNIQVSSSSKCGGARPRLLTLMDPVYKGSDPAHPKLTGATLAIDGSWPYRLIMPQDLAPYRPFIRVPLNRARPWEPITGLTKLQGDDTDPKFRLHWPLLLLSPIACYIDHHHLIFRRAWPSWWPNDTKSRQAGQGSCHNDPWV